MAEKNDCSNPFLPLTEERKQTFRNALAVANERYRNFLITDAQASKDMDNRDLSGFRRAFVKAALKDAFRDDANICVRDVNGMFVICIGTEVAMIIRRVDPNTLLCEIPKTLERAKDGPRQEPLPELGDFMNGELPLSNYDQHWIGGYIPSLDGAVDSFYFTMHDGQTLFDHLELDLSLAAYDVPTNFKQEIEAEEPTGTVFRLKNIDSDEEDRAAGGNQ